MESYMILILLLLAAGSCSAQILELPIQDQIPKMLLSDCPDTPYPIVMSSMSSMELWSNQYLVCLRGIPLIFNCSNGLFFNPDRLTCEYHYERRSIIDMEQQEYPDLPQFPVPINPDRRAQGPRPITRPNSKVSNPLPVRPSKPNMIAVPYRPF